MDKAKANQLEQLLCLYAEEKSSSPTANMLENWFISLIATEGENAASPIASTVNKLMAVASSRHKGLVLLNKVVPYCPTEMVTENAAAWINHCINCNSKESSSALKLTILVGMIRLCREIPEFNKILQASLPKIVDICISVNPKTVVLNEHSLECISILMQKYPGATSPFRNKIELYLLKYITSPLSATVVRKAGCAFHYLQQTGGGGPDGITHKNNWSGQINRLCATIHKLYRCFFANVTEYESTEVEGAPLEFTELCSGAGEAALTSTATALKNTIIFIDCFLVKSFPVEKLIPVARLLDTIKRGLVVDIYTGSDKSMDEMHFASLLCAHQIDLLYLLRSLIACCKTNIIPFSFTITKLLTDLLQRTHKKYFKTKSEFQKAVYQVLNYWVTTAGNKINGTMHNKLVSLILEDITPIESNITLCLNENLSKKAAKKAKKRSLQEAITKTNGRVRETNKKLLEVREMTCIEALKAASTLLEHIMLQLDQNTSKNFLQTLIHQLTNIQGGKAAHPYTSLKCQVHLHEVLVNVFSQPAFCSSPLLQVAINAFARGQNHNNDRIASVCRRGLDLMEKMCQSICPTLGIDLESDDDDTPRPSSKKQRLGETRTVDESLHDDEQNTAIVPDSPPCNGVSQSSGSKINILDVQIIKEAEDLRIEEPEKTAEESVKPTAQMEVDEASHEEVAPVPEPEVIVVESEDNSMGCSELGAKPTEVPVTVDDAPVQKIAEEDENDEETAMLESFNDVLNET